MHLTRWNKETAPSPEALRAALTGEGFHVSEWSDPPGTVYPVHTHEYAEVRWVVQGRLRVGLPESGEEFTLSPGDRLELAPNSPHWVDVDAGLGVLYLVGTKAKNGHKKS
jgi:quercetin dioxygenase-like cupin family protein